MAICAFRETLLQEVTGICRGRVYPVAKKKDVTIKYSKLWII